jgi:hypothetical protein
MLRDRVGYGFSKLTTWKMETHFNWGSDRWPDLMGKQEKSNVLGFHTRKQAVEDPLWAIWHFGEQQRLIGMSANIDGIFKLFHTQNLI